MCVGYDHDRVTHDTPNYRFWRGVVAGTGLRTENQANPPLANSALQRSIDERLFFFRCYRGTGETVAAVQKIAPLATLSVVEETRFWVWLRNQKPL